MIVVDATGLVMGRLASVTAKSLLAGEEINIVNAEKALITGGKDSIFEDYGHTRERGHKERGPYFPRRPEMILKRMKTGTQMSPPPMPTSVPNVPTPMPSNRKRRI